MELREWDDKVGPSGHFVEVEYPDKIVKDFVDYFRCTKRWRERDELELIYHRWLKFERELTEWRNEANLQAARQPEQVAGCTGKTRAGNPCQIKHGIVDGKCHIHRPYRALTPA